MAEKKRRKPGYLLPDDINPANRLYVCVPIPDDPAHIRAFLGQLDYLSYWYTWEKDELKRGKEVAQVWREIVSQIRFAIESNEGCEGMTIQLRQSPENPCILEQSWDGINWSFAFDYSLCTPSYKAPSSAVMDDLDQATTVIQELNNIYQGDITNIFTYAYGGGLDVYLDDVQCWAYRMLVDSICQAAIDIKAKQAEGTDTLDILREFFAGAGGIGSLIFGVVGFTTAGLVALVIAVMGALAQVAILILDKILSTPAEVLSDEEAKEDVACCMYNALKGGTPSFDAFKNALSGCNFNAESPAGQLRTLIHDFLQSQDVYLSLFRIANDLVPAAQAGADLACPCEGEWCYTFDFVTGGAYGWQLQPVNGAGNYVAGTGWQAANFIDTISNPDIAGRACNIYITLPARTITEISMIYDVALGDNTIMSTHKPLQFVPTGTICAC